MHMIMIETEWLTKRWVAKQQKSTKELSAWHKTCWVLNTVNMRMIKWYHLAMTASGKKKRELIIRLWQSQFYIITVQTDSISDIKPITNTNTWHYLLTGLFSSWKPLNTCNRSR